MSADHTPSPTRPASSTQTTYQPSTHLESAADLTSTTASVATGTLIAPPPTAGPGVQDGSDALTAVKPLMRGWLHLGMVPVALIAGLVLIITTDSLVGRLAEGIYLVTALMLFGNSASYHLGHWTPRVRQVFRRFDHSNIAIFIAGTYTPLAVLLLGGASRVVLLAVIWGLALAEVVLRNVWLAAPRWLYTLLYVAMGWAALFWLGQMVASGGLAVLILLLAGGLAYTAGALVYALKRPNISLRWFGFHELFHAGTIVGAGCHFAAIWLAAH